jgi:hypothetical protein
LGNHHYDLYKKEEHEDYVYFSYSEKNRTLSKPKIVGKIILIALVTFTGIGTLLGLYILGHRYCQYNELCMMTRYEKKAKTSNERVNFFPVKKLEKTIDPPIVPSMNLSNYLS